MAKKGKASEASMVRGHMIAALQLLTRSGPVATYAKDLQKSCGIALRSLERSRQDAWHLRMAPWTLELRSARYRGQENYSKIVMAADTEAISGRLVRQTVPICLIVKPQCFSHGPPWCKHPADQSGEAATRRIHFDYDADVTTWPKHHLQIGGNAEELTSAGSYYYAVAEDPSEPRVPAAPLDFVLALDLVMRQFETGLELPQEPGWRKLVMRSEELSLKPYFASVCDELRRSGRDIPLVEYLSQ